MNQLKIKKSGKRGHSKGRGFYVALAVCLVAVGAAAWTTYDGVQKYMAIEDPTSQQSSQAPEQEAGNTLSGIKEEVSSQSSRQSSSQPSNQQPSSSNASSEETSQAADPVSEPASSAPEEPVSSAEQETFANQPGACIYPSGSTVTKEFSNGNPVYSLTMGDWRAHDGTDFRAEAGSMVKAVTNGTVKDVYDDPLLGRTVVIDHYGFEAYYCGLGETTLVKTGDQVERGQEIGSIQIVPCEMNEESHLHFAVQKDGAWVNPMDIINGTN